MADEQKAPEVQQGETKANPEAKYTDKDVDEIVSKKFAQWKSKHEAEVAEAQKLAEMNATEKAAMRSAPRPNSPHSVRPLPQIAKLGAAY